MTRREFLEFNALFGAAALTGCTPEPVGLGWGGKGAPMQGFRCAPLKRVRIAIAGMGGRGTSAMYRLAQIPGCSITGLCDLRQNHHVKSTQTVGGDEQKRIAEIVNIPHFTAVDQLDAGQFSSQQSTIGSVLHDPLNLRR